MKDPSLIKFVECKVVKNNIRIELEGEIDGSNATATETAILFMLEQIDTPILTLDLAHIHFMSKEGLKMLTKLHLKSLSKGGQCYFISPQKGVEKMLRFSPHFHEFKIRYFPKMDSL